jgi:hypothetical protein
LARHGFAASSNTSNDNDHYEYIGDTLSTFTRADITKYSQACIDVQIFKSEISTKDIINKISSLRDDIKEVPTQFQHQLDNMSKMIKMLGDTTFDSYLKVDGRLLADLLSQVLIALKLISVQPTLLNLSLIFSSCLSKLRLSDQVMKKCLTFIDSAIEVMIASIQTLGFKSEASISTVIDTFMKLCGGVGTLIEDKALDIIIMFIAKLSSFWATLSGGFSEMDFKISNLPLITSKVRSIFNEGGDIFEAILGSYEWITQNFAQFIKGDFSMCLFGKAETAAFETRISRVRKMYPLLISGSLTILKEEYNHTPSSYDLEVSALIKNADRMMKKAKDSQRPALKRMSDELREIQTDRLLKQSQIQTKISAIGICFVGGSGVGKSLLMEQTARTLISASGEVPTGDKIVSGQMSDKFDSNELPHHLVLMYDDVANNSNNENFDKLLNAVNSQSRPFLKAAVEEKGLMFPNNIACIISTNVPGYNAYKSNCPDSLGRRFLHIEVALKPKIMAEICVPGTKRIDPIKASAQGPRMDIWEFTVYEFVTYDDLDEDAPLDVIRWHDMNVRKLQWTNKDLEDQTYWDLALFLQKRAKIHFDSQRKLLDSLLTKQQEDYCPHCNIPMSVCACGVKSELFDDIQDLGIDRLISQYEIFVNWKNQFWNFAKFRIMLGLCLTLIPLNISKYLFSIISSIFICAILKGSSLSQTLLLICAFTPICLVSIIIHTWYSLYKRMSTRRGILTHLAEESYTVIKNYRDSIFIGAGLASFAYVLYKTMRPKSEFLSFREQIPESIRSTFTRAEKARTTPIDNILPSMKRDLGTIKVEYDGIEHKCLTFPIYGNFYVTVGHLIPKNKDFCVTIIHESSQTPTISKQKMNDAHVYRFPNKDLVLLQIPSAVPRKGYCDYLLGNETSLGTQAVTLVSLDIPTSQRYTSSTRLEPGWSTFSSNVKTDKVTLYKPYQYLCPGGTKGGMCGSLIVDFSKSIIYGFHVAGNTKIGLCNTLTRKEVLSAMETFNGFIPVNQGNLQLGSHSIEKGLGMVELVTGDESVDKPVSEHNCLVEGILPGASATFKSPYREHPYYNDIVENFGIETCAPPQKVNDPFHKRKALTKLTTPNQEFSLDEVEYAANDYISDILDKVDTYSYKEIKEISRILTLQEALDGIGEKSLGGIDNSTSVGFPFRGKKMDFLERDPMDINLPITPRELRESFGFNIENEVLKMIEIYKQDKSCRPLFKCSMKTNELVPKHKFKARVFMGSNFPFLLVCRMYLAPFIRMASRNKFLFESAKGINMDSIEAEELQQYLSGNEDRTVALDYSAFDQTMSAQVSTAVSSCIIKLMRQMKCSDEHIQIVRGILTDINYPNLHFFGTLIQLANSDPSGNPITTELNGGVNSIYLRIFFFRIYKDLKNKIRYREAIKTMTYGDDNINAIPIKYSKFNGTNIVAEGKKCGLTITMADKDAAITDFTHLHDSDFLKRKFRFCPDLGHIRAPLSKESIIKSFYFMKNTSPDPPEVLFSQNVDGALRKSSQYGIDYFTEVRDKLLSIAIKHDVKPLCKWWTYSEIIKYDKYNYYDHYRGVPLYEAPNIDVEQSSFKSESFIAPPIISFVWTKIFTIIAEMLLSLIPFVKAGRYTDIRTSLRQYYGALTVMTFSHYIFPENLFGGDKARWLTLGHRLRGAFIDLWITQQNDIIRVQPFCIVLEGPAGTGKTTCALALIKELFKESGGITRSEIVILNEDDEFQSEFRTHHRVVILDDVNNTTSTFISSSPLRRVIDFVNNVPKRALNPEADLKGTVKIQPDLVIITTNSSDAMNSTVFTNCSDSIMRRCHFVKVFNKKNYTFSNGILDVHGWDLQVIPKSHGQNYGSKTNYNNHIQLDNTKPIDFKNFFLFSDYFRELFITHMDGQSKFVNMINDYFDSGFKSESSITYPPGMNDSDCDKLRKFKSFGQFDYLIIGFKVIVVFKGINIDFYYLDHSGVREAMPFFDLPQCHIHNFEKHPKYLSYDNYKIMKSKNFMYEFKSESFITIVENIGTMHLCILQLQNIVLSILAIVTIIPYFIDHMDKRIIKFCNDIAERIFTLIKGDYIHKEGFITTELRQILSLGNIKVDIGSTPSKEEEIAQDKSITRFGIENLIAREVTLTHGDTGVSCDLIFLRDGIYIFLEAKAGKFAKTKTQALTRKQMLSPHLTHLDHIQFIAYQSGTDVSVVV